MMASRCIMRISTTERYGHPLGTIAGTGLDQNIHAEALHLTRET